MSFSGTAIEQRGKEEKALKAFLAFSVIASLGLHLGVLASGIVNNFLKQVQEIDKEPIEVAIIETPAPKPIEKPKELVKPPQEPPKPKAIVPIKPQSVAQPKPVLPKPPVLPPVVPKQTVVVPKPPVVPKQTVVVPKPPVVPKRTVVVTKPVVPPPKIVTPPVEKPEPLPKIPLDTQSKPDPAPKPQPDENLKQTLRTLRAPRTIPAPVGGGGGGGGGNSPRIATGSGEGTVRSGTGTGTGIGTGTGSGIGSGTGSGIGSGTGSGIGSGTGSGIGSGTGSGIGSGTGSGIGSGQGSGKAQVATAPKPKTPAPTQFDYAECIRCDKPKYPEKLERRGIEGTSGVAFDIDKNGNTYNVRVISPSSHKEFDEALKEAVKDYKFKSIAAGKQNVQRLATFSIKGSRSNREALQRTREQQERLEAKRKRQQEAQQRSRETVANEEENSGRRRRDLSTTPEVAPQTTPETGIRGGQDVPSTPTESNSEQVTPQPPTLTQPPEQNSSSEQNELQPSSRRKRNLGTSDNQNDLGEQLRRSQNQSQPSEEVPSNSSGNNE